MKRAMYKWMIPGLAAAMLSGCGSWGGQGVNLEESDAQDGVHTEAESGDNAGSGAGQDSSREIPSQTLSSEEKAMYEAYVKVLEDVYFDQVLPGGMECGLQPEDADISENKFAVWDIDSDGKDELLISYTTTYMAGMTESIYAYDSGSGEVRREHLGFPFTTYYDNGIIEEPASHNQGMASDGGADGNFWPYSLYRYDSDSDAYVPIGSVDAWSRGYREQDYDGNPFPEEADLDGDGVVYYVMEGDYYLVNPMDGAEYSQWRDSCLEGAKQLQVPYMDLTTDNIYALTNRDAALAD